MLVGPLTWLILLETHYVLSYVACETRETWFMHVATGAALVIVTAAGVLAWRASHGHPLTPEHVSSPLSDETRRQRARWMSATGMALSALFILVILAMEVPIIMLRTCQ
jgi:hypothetical protein